jgi:hypothetical protein
MGLRFIVVSLIMLLCANGLIDAFICKRNVSHCKKSVATHAANEENSDFFGGVKAFFQELDNFLDDATARRLGNGAAFYGKRKSNFYGEKDKNRKSDPMKPDPLEDFQAPLNGGYFQWMPDENGDLRPVTRMKKKIVERNPSFWDKIYEKEAK